MSFRGLGRGRGFTETGETNTTGKNIRAVLDGEYRLVKDLEKSPDKALIESANTLIEKYEASGDTEDTRAMTNRIDKTIDVGNLTL